MNFSQLLSLLVAALGVFGASGFTLKAPCVSSTLMRATTASIETQNKLTEIVEVKVIVSGKNVQGPWYRTTVRHEVRIINPRL